MDGDGPQLLVCDDSTVERKALAQFLRSRGYGVEEAGDGDSALRQLKMRRVDLLLLDLLMPRTDGFDVLKYVQEHRQALPVILLSGMPPDQIQHKMHALPSGELPPLLLKPIDPEQLIQVIEFQLGGDLPTENRADVIDQAD